MINFNVLLRRMVNHNLKKVNDNKNLKMERVYKIIFYNIKDAYIVVSGANLNNYFLHYKHLVPKINLFLLSRF
jgi:hypothetical protein